MPDNHLVTAHLILPQATAPEGLAHYTEHLAWLNTIGDQDRDADRHSNAWTNDHAIGYWLSGAPDDLPNFLETLSGAFDPIDLPRDFAEEERDIILREYDYRLADNIDGQTSEAMDAFLYEGNAIATSVIGSPEEIAGFDYDAARELHAATHRAETATLIVTGDVSEWQVRRAMREAGWPELEDERADIAPSPFDLTTPERTTLRYPDANVAPRMIWRHVVTLPEPVPFDLLEARTALLRDILDTNLPGGLAGPLRFDAAIARSFDVHIWPIDEDNIEISFRAAPDRTVSLTEMRDAFEDTLAEIAATGIPPATYTRVRARFDGFWPDWDDEDETADWMADYVLARASALREPLSEHDLQQLESGLSLDATNALLRQLAGEGRTAVAFIGPEERFE